MKDENFKAEKISQTETIVLNGIIEKVFPLFGAFEERKWANGWAPQLIYPEEERIEEGTTFLTEGFDDEPTYLWRVTKYAHADSLIQYLVSTENRYWTITVKCKAAINNCTTAEVTYTYLGLNKRGNELNKKSINRIYADRLKDWEEEINAYLAKA